MVRKMKRITLLILISALFANPIFSRVTTLEEAKKVATLWIQIENLYSGVANPHSDYSLKEISELIYRNENIGYLAEISPCGFMVISAITELSPVKYFSFSSSYERVKDAVFTDAVLEELLYSQIKFGYYRDIDSPAGPFHFRYTEKQVSKITNDNNLLWNQTLLIDSLNSVPQLAIASSVGPLLKTNWHQEYPYNLYAPVIDGTRAPIGCVATAFAQIMNYWKYPIRGEGFIRDYRAYAKKEIFADFNHTYDWSYIQDSYNGTESQSSIEAVARLHIDVAIAMGMAFTPTSSFTIIDGNKALVSYFKYSQDQRTVQTPYYGDLNEFFLELKKQINQNWPVVLGITSDNNYHATVLDGYREEMGQNLVSIKFGWGTYGVGVYYTLDNISSMRADSAVINIYPEDLSISGGISGMYYDHAYTDGWYVNVGLYPAEADPAYNPAGTPRPIKFAIHDDSGKYEFQRIKPGDYRVAFDFYNISGFGYRRWYNNKVEFSEANIVTVKEGEVTSPIDSVSLNPALSGIRKEARAWSIKRDYGDIRILVENIEFFPNLKIDLLRKADGGEYKIIKSLFSGDFKESVFSFVDKYLEKNKKYSYLLEARPLGNDTRVISKELIL